MPPKAIPCSHCRPTAQTETFPDCRAAFSRYQELFELGRATNLCSQRSGFFIVCHTAEQSGAEFQPGTQPVGIKL